MRYVQEYANFQRLQGMEIERKQKQIAAKKREVEQTKHAKQNLLKQGEVEKAKTGDSGKGAPDSFGEFAKEAERYTKRDKEEKTFG